MNSYWRWNIRQQINQNGQISAKCWVVRCTLVSIESVTVSRNRIFPGHCEKCRCFFFWNAHHPSRLGRLLVFSYMYAQIGGVSFTRCTAVYVICHINEFFQKSLSNWSNSSDWTKQNYRQVTVPNKGQWIICTVI